MVDRLISQGADVEAQSERTKDTALSLACTKGRYEVCKYSIVINLSAGIFPRQLLNFILSYRWSSSS